MEINWTEGCQLMLDLVERSEATGKGQYSNRKVFGLIRLFFPDWTQLHPEVDARTPFSREQLTEWLYDTPEYERGRILEQVSLDLMNYFPRECRLLLSLSAQAQDESESSLREKNYEKANRYLRRIDSAITNGRYNLAFNLTNRLLKEYYRAFLHTYAVPLNSPREELPLMSISVCRYLLKYFQNNRIPFNEKRLLLMTTVTNVLFTTQDNLKKSPNTFAVDKAIAIYARNNVNRIARFLSRFL